MKKNITASVGIRAYNEEANIANVIRDMFLQKKLGWKLSEILVYSNGSTHKTSQKVTKIKDKKIIFTEGKVRIGETKRLNQMPRNFTGDVPIIFDADIKLKNRNVTLNSACLPFLSTVQKRYSLD